MNIFFLLTIRAFVRLDIESEGASALKNAWGELAAIEKETRRYKEVRERTEDELEMCRQKGVQLEDVSGSTLNQLLYGFVTTSCSIITAGIT